MSAARGLPASCSVPLTAVTNAGEIAVLAAGSLRAPLTDIARAFERESGDTVMLTFGASGLLRDRIEKGERADVFASANMEHPQSLAATGWASRVARFACNRMCILALPSVTVTSETALATMLDPGVRLGTSTPKADPSGDYAWEVFRKADLQKPGSFAALSAKALQLTGGPQSPTLPADGNVYAALVAEGMADVFLTYYTSADLARKEQPALQLVRLPESLQVGADYGIAVRRDAQASATRFVAYVLSPEGIRRLSEYGFDSP